MRNIYNALLLVIAGATHKQLARHVAYLKVENKILRSKLSVRVTVSRLPPTRVVARLKPRPKQRHGPLVHGLDMGVPRSPSGLNFGRELVLFGNRLPQN